MPTSQNYHLLDNSVTASHTEGPYSHYNQPMDSISVEPEPVGYINEASPEAGPSVTCRVCEHEIPLQGRMNNHVIRCSQCNEATPIRAPPPGKKYVRCPCHCLLICKASSSRIACPRENCRRVITLGPPGGPMDDNTAIRAPAGTCRVQCCQCQELFMFNTLNNSPAHCPHCQKISSVGNSYKHTRTIVWFILFVVAAAFSIGFTVSLRHGWYIWILAIGSIALAGWSLCKYLYYLQMGVSQVLGPV